MALKLPVRFPIFASPVNPNPNFNTDHRLWSLEVRCSRWSNANAENFNQHRSTQKDIEDDIHRERQFDSASKSVNVNDNEISSDITTTVKKAAKSFRTAGITSPSIPSFSVKKSKHSKDLCPDSETHPAFKFSNLAVHKRKPKFKDRPVTEPANISLSKDGVSYVIDGAPFEFKYSYTETPKVEPLKLREPPFVPFGPTTMPRPWTGRAPLPPSKKKLKEFDSFVLPPPHKKGVKPVQAPGPFLPGSGPKYVNSREEILGETLTEEEIAELVKSCIKTKRQMNIGRDGLTHNMLDNIHAHWKRRRVCKIKCKGVCTVDMDNVCQQLEERTGGKIIHRKGGTVYLFRGRNYNYKTRPHFPLMLWKPAPPVYPRLIQKVPEGLTMEAATEMREKGRKLIPISKLGKNGVYCGLVKTVREAFEECELVRINCQGMNSSDFRKIGAKLRDLVPCVLLSFEREHILMWRGQNWQSSILSPSDDNGEVNKVSVTGQTSGALTHEGQEISAITEKLIKNEISDTGCPDEYTNAMDFKENGMPSVNLASDSTSNVGTDISDISCLPSEGTFGKEFESSSVGSTQNYEKGHSEAIDATYANAITMDENGFSDGHADVITESNTVSQIVGSPTSKAESLTVSSSADEKLTNVARALSITQPLEVSVSCTEAVISLMKKAVDEGVALVLDEDSLDADIVFQKAVSFSKSAPPGLTFGQKRKKLVQKTEKIEENEPENKEVKIIPSNKDSQKSSDRRRSKYFDERYMNLVPQGSLRIDELAKLLG